MTPGGVRKPDMLIWMALLQTTGVAEAKGSEITSGMIQILIPFFHSPPKQHYVAITVEHDIFDIALDVPVNRYTASMGSIDQGTEQSLYAALIHLQFGSVRLFIVCSIDIAYGNQREQVQ